MVPALDRRAGAHDGWPVDIERQALRPEEGDAEEARREDQGRAPATTIAAAVATVHVYNKSTHDAANTEGGSG